MIYTCVGEVASSGTVIKRVREAMKLFDMQMSGNNYREIWISFSSFAGNNTLSASKYFCGFAELK